MSDWFLVMHTYKILLVSIVIVTLPMESIRQELAQIAKTGNRASEFACDYALHAAFPPFYLILLFFFRRLTILLTKSLTDYRHLVG